VVSIKKSYVIQEQRKIIAQLLTPCIKGDMVVVRVEEVDYFKGLEDCKNHLLRRIILSKGDQPLTQLDLTKNLQIV